MWWVGVGITHTHPPTLILNTLYTHTHPPMRKYRWVANPGPTLNQQPPKSQDLRSDVLAQLAQPSAEVIFQLEGGLRTTVTGRER